MFNINHLLQPYFILDPSSLHSVLWAKNTHVCLSLLSCFPFEIIPPYAIHRDYSWTLLIKPWPNNWIWRVKADMTPSHIQRELSLDPCHQNNHKHCQKWGTNKLCYHCSNWQSVMHHKWPKLVLKLGNYAKILMNFRHYRFKENNKQMYFCLGFFVWPWHPAADLLSGLSCFFFGLLTHWHQSDRF